MILTTDRLAYNKQWRKNNVEYVKEYNKKYYAENTDFKKDSYKKWAEQNQEHLKKYRKEYSIKNADHLKEIQKTRYNNKKSELKEKHQKWIENNRERRDKQHKEYIEKYNKKRRELVNSIKTRYKCFFCKEKDPVILEFHHVNQSMKSFTIGQKIFIAYDKIISEIRKCICLCANCHKKIHMKALVLPEIDLDEYHKHLS